RTYVESSQVSQEAPSHATVASVVSWPLRNPSGAAGPSPDRPPALCGSDADHYSEPMNIARLPPPTVWYPNPQGHTQWWDGERWGPYAPPAVPQRPTKDAGIAYLLLILLGGFGAHRFYLGQAAVGVIILVLWCGGLLLSFLGVGFF